VVFKPNKLYQLVNSPEECCIGCILRSCSDDSTRGTIVHKGSAGWCNKVCMCVQGETWVEISEERAMEVMLGG